DPGILKYNFKHLSPHPPVIINHSLLSCTSSLQALALRAFKCYFCYNISLIHIHCWSAYFKIEMPPKIFISFYKIITTQNYRAYLTNSRR
ncbi:hypothetical protein L9F63_009462, partial [Diploptera punctata]